MVVFVSIVIIDWYDSEKRWFAVPQTVLYFVHRRLRHRCRRLIVNDAIFISVKKSLYSHSQIVDTAKICTWNQKKQQQPNRFTITRPIYGTTILRYKLKCAAKNKTYRDKYKVTWIDFESNLCAFKANVSCIFHQCTHYSLSFFLNAIQLVVNIAISEKETEKKKLKKKMLK